MRIISATSLAFILGVQAATSAISAPSIVGLWSGRGEVRLTSGQVERVSCRVRFEKGDRAGRTFVLNAKCAAAGGTFLLYGRISKRGPGSYRGSLFGEQHTVSGKVAITLQGDSQIAQVSSARGAGLVKLIRR